MSQISQSLKNIVLNNLNCWLLKLEKSSDKQAANWDKHLIVSCSGGKDSTALLTLLVELNLPRISLSVLHINHHLRAADSNADETFVKHLAQKNSIPFEAYDGSLHGNQIKSQNIQNEARKIRLKYWQKSREVWQDYYQKNKQDKQIWLVTAHHLDDQIENFFMKLMRGTSLSGLVGQTLFCPLTKFLRPFHGVTAIRSFSLSR